MKFKLCAVGLHFCLFAIILDAIDATYKVRNFRKQAAIDDKKCSQTVFVIMVKSIIFFCPIRKSNYFRFSYRKIVCFFIAISFYHEHLLRLSKHSWLVSLDWHIWCVHKTMADIVQVEMMEGEYYFTIDFLIEKNSLWSIKISRIFVKCFFNLCRSDI